MGKRLQEQIVNSIINVIGHPFIKFTNVDLGPRILCCGRELFCYFSVMLFAILLVRRKLLGEVEV